MSNLNSCPCPTGDVAVTTVTSPLSRKSKVARLLLSFALVFGAMLFANAPSAFAQHTTGLNVAKTITPNTPVVQGTSVTVTVTIENQDADHGVKNLAVTNTVPFPGGTTSPVAGCSTTLTASDGVPGSGTDFTTCTFQEPTPITCNPENFPQTDQINASGLDDAPGTIFDNLPVSGSATNTVIVTPIVCDPSTECVTNACVPEVGCVPTNQPDSTACGTDADTTDCKLPGCEAGVCVQAHSNVADSTACTSTPDVAGDCGTPGCEAGVCVADHVPVTDSTPCSVGVTGTPDECKEPGCEGGVCVAAHVNKPDSTTCTDTTPECGFIAGCEGGSCVQNHTPEECGGNEGCTPGFFKANADKKGANAWPVPPATLLNSVFTIPACISGCTNIPATLTLRQALDLQGGNDLCGKAEILLRAAVAAYLNSLSTCVEFPVSTGTLIADVNAALASCDPEALITLATTLDGFNNLGCPINQNEGCPNPPDATILPSSINAPKP